MEGFQRYHTDFVAYVSLQWIGSPAWCVASMLAPVCGVPEWIGRASATLSLGRFTVSRSWPLAAVVGVNWRPSMAISRTSPAATGNWTRLVVAPATSSLDATVTRPPFGADL